MQLSNELQFKSTTLFLFDDVNNEIVRCLKVKITEAKAIVIEKFDATIDIMSVLKTDKFLV